MKHLFYILFFLLSTKGFAQNNDTINFENYTDSSINSVIYIDSMDGNWQIGKPSKVIFDNSLSYPNALLTDSINIYPINQDNYVYFHFNHGNSSIATSGGEATGFINFDFKCDLDSLNDYVQIEYFTGQWEPLQYYNYYQNYIIGFDGNYYFPPEVNNLPLFTGSEINWQHVRISLQCWAMFEPTIEDRGAQFNEASFRIHFHSDSIFDNREGFMLDNLVFENFIGICPTSVAENYTNNEIVLVSNITNSILTFESDNELFSQITIYDINGKRIENFVFSPSNFKTLQIPNLANGLYFYSVDEGKAMGKFIIEK